MDVESIAVSAVKDAISSTDYLQEYITDKDKGPAFDGCINVYSVAGNNYSKDKLESIVPVQIKGKVVNDSSKKNIKYQIATSDLNIFLRRGGCLFFVVYIDHEIHKKIYYAPLLPFEINRYLKGKSNQQTISVYFYTFPTDTNEIVNVVKDFARDMDRQVILKNCEYNLVQAKEDIDISKLRYGFSYTGLGYDKNQIADYLLNHDLYLYASNQSKNINIVLGHITKTTEVIVKSSASIGTGGEQYYSSVDIKHTHEGKYLSFGNEIKVGFSNGNIKLTYNLTGNLDQRIHDSEFILALFDNKEITINEKSIEIDPEKGDTESLHLNELRADLRYLNQVQSVLSSLGIEKSFEISKMDSKEEQYLNLLLIALGEKKTIQLKEDPEQPVIALKIGNLKVLLYFRCIKEHVFKIQNYFRTKVNVSCEDNDGNKFPTSQFVILEKNAYLTIDNLDFKSIEDDMKRFKNPFHFVKVYYSVMEMLKAYDQEHSPSLLQLAERLLQWLRSSDAVNIDFYTLNLYQCYRRERKLNPSEIQGLCKMSERWKDNNSIEAGIFILLGRQKDAVNYIAKMDQTEKNEFVNSPIYIFFQNDMGSDA